VVALRLNCKLFLEELFIEELFIEELFLEEKSHPEFSA